MAQYLSPTTHLVRLGEDLVVLDARTNAYFCLPGAGDALSQQAGALRFTDHALALAFDEAGFLDAEPFHHEAPPDAATQDLGLAVADRLSLRDLATVLGAWIWMLTAYHRQPFDRLLATARQGRKAPPSAPPAAMSALVAAFTRILPWLPFQGVCLYRSLLLLRVLRRRGYDARWVFGVHTWPFQAHCWLQVGDTVLDDTADRLTAFTPIMVV